MATNPPNTPSLPAACAECLTLMSPAQGGAQAAQQFPMKLFRSADGKMRVDSGNMSVITDLVSKQTITLDHLTKEARIGGLPPGFQMPTMPQMNPALAGMPQKPPLNIKDLGKAFIDGHEVHGQQFTFAPPQVPTVPQPGTPQMPAAPVPPPIVTEIWTSTKLGLPVLTKTKTPTGEQICKCKVDELAAAPPTMFQIPPGYKTIPMPVAPTPPTLPQAPQAPKLPG